MILEEMATRIEAISGIGLNRPPTHPANLWLHHLPDEPDKAVSLMLGQGRPPDGVLDLGGSTTLAGKATIDNFMVTIWSRNVTGALAEATALLIYNSMVDVVNTTISGTRWLMAQPMGPPHLASRDRKERFVFGFNVLVKREGG